MYELELIEGHEAAEKARKTLLHICEVCTQDQIELLVNVLGEGGPAYNLRVINKLLQSRGRLDESKRLGAFFRDYPDGFGDPVVRATFLLGVKEIMKSDGQLDADKALEVLNELKITVTPDLRDELQRMAIVDPAGKKSWSVLDVVGTVLSSVTIAQLAKQVPWAKLARWIILRKP